GRMPTPQESWNSCGVGILPAPVFTLFISTYLFSAINLKIGWSALLDGRVGLNPRLPQHQAA
ncbi:hypothetical protein ACE1CI_05225, partial [Aerosakkonemataceae cyanobacterium BLCC-F50]